MNQQESTNISDKISSYISMYSDDYDDNYKENGCLYFDDYYGEYTFCGLSNDIVCMKHLTSMFGPIIFNKITSGLISKEQYRYKCTLLRKEYTSNNITNIIRCMFNNNKYSKEEYSLCINTIIDDKIRMLLEFVLSLKYITYR